MESLFLDIVNISITAGWFILAVMLLRMILKKAPKWIFCALWALVAFRLICPFSIESALSLIPSAQPLSQELFSAPLPSAGSPLSGTPGTFSPAFPSSSAADPGDSASPLQIWLFAAACIWLTGAAILLLYAIVSFLLLKHRLATATLFAPGIKQSEKVESPFVLGFFRPIIYLPYTIAENDLEYVIAHERAHIQRKDHWWKPVGFIILSVYWFHPLVWAAYLLLCRDIEAACDEKVIASTNQDYRRAYSTALLNCSITRRHIAACPIAFGETSVKSRIKSVMNYKKPAFWLILAAVILSLATAICLITVPKEKSPDDPSPLNYKNVITILPDDGTLQVIHYPETDPRKKEEGKILLGVSDCVDFAEYLENSEWKERRAPSDSPASPGSIEFIIEEEYRITVYRQPRIARVSYYDEERWYRTDRKDYDSAVEIAYSPDTLSADTANPTDTTDNIFPFGHIYRVNEVTYESPVYSFSYTVDTAPFFTLTSDHILLAAWDRQIDMSTDSFTQLGAFSKTRLTEENFDDLFLPGKLQSNLFSTTSIIETIRKNTRQAWRIDVEEDENNVFFYLLLTNDNEVYLSYGYDAADGKATIRWLFRLERIDLLNCTAVSEGVIAHIEPCYYANDFDFEYEVLSVGEFIGSGSLVLSADWEGDILTVGEDYYENNGTGVTVKRDTHKLTRNGYGNFVLLLEHRNPDQEESAVYFIRGNNNIEYVFRITFTPKTTNGESPDDTEATDPLETAVSSAIMAHYDSGEPDGLIYAEGHILLGSESKSDADGQTDTIDEITLYLLVLKRAHAVYDPMKIINGGYGPVAITFIIDSNGQYQLKEYWEPRNGSYYEEDIRNKFPEPLADEVLINHQNYVTELDRLCTANAEAKFNRIAGIDNNTLNLPGDTMLYPTDPSHLSDEYIETHPDEFRAMLGNDEAALRYCFGEFLKGDQKGKKAEIMSEVCEEIMLFANAASSEAVIIDWTDPENVTGQLWFDAFQSNAKRLAEQYTSYELKKYFPISALLLEMMEEL